MRDLVSALIGLVILVLFVLGCHFRRSEEVLPKHERWQVTDALVGGGHRRRDPGRGRSGQHAATVQRHALDDVRVRDGERVAPIERIAAPRSSSSSSSATTRHGQIGLATAATIPTTTAAAVATTVVVVAVYFWLWRCRRQRHRCPVLRRGGRRRRAIAHHAGRGRRCGRRERRHLATLCAVARRLCC